MVKLVLIVVAVLLLWMPCAFACSCTTPTPLVALERADLVFADSVDGKVGTWLCSDTVPCRWSAPTRYILGPPTYAPTGAEYAPASREQVLAMLSSPDRLLV